jgi:hypothetical protein
MISRVVRFILIIKILNNLVINLFHVGVFNPFGVDGESDHILPRISSGAISIEAFQASEYNLEIIKIIQKAN